MERVVITGLGVLSALGSSPDELFRRLLAGETGVRRLPALIGTPIDVGPLAAASLPGNPDSHGNDSNENGQAILSEQPRAGRFLSFSTEQALRQARLFEPSSRDRLRVGACVGTTLGEKAPWLFGLAQKAQGNAPSQVLFGCGLLARQLAQHLRAERLSAISTACCSGNSALALGLSWLRHDVCDVVVCAGVDVLQPFVISGFRALRAQSADVCRPFDRRRSGVNLGEASACVVLEKETVAASRGQRVLACLAGAGLSKDAHHMTAPDAQGRGACLAMQRALFDAELSSGSVDFLSSHGTGTPFNDLMEGQAFARLLGDRVLDVPVHSIKGSVGHCLGAAAMIEAVVTVCILAHQVIPPTVGLEEVDPQISLDLVCGKPREARVRCVVSTASGFGGENAAVVLTDTSMGKRPS